MMTAALALINRSVLSLLLGFPRADIHASHSQNTRQGRLGPYVHLQVPHQGNRQKTQGQITYCSGDTVDIGHGDDMVQLHAGAMNIGMRVRVKANSLPEELNRLALQRQHEPEDQTNRTSDANDSP